VRSHPEIVEDIKNVLKDKVAPSVAAHNGEIKFISFHKGVVRLLLSGSCSGCAMSKITLHRGVENTLKHYIPEVNSLVGEDDEEGSRTRHGVQNKMPSWITRILTPLILSNFY